MQGVEVAGERQPKVCGHPAEVRQPRQGPDKALVLLAQKVDFAFQVILVGRAQHHEPKLFHLPFCLVLSKTPPSVLCFFVIALTQVEAQLGLGFYLLLTDLVEFEIILKLSIQGFDKC